MIARRPSWGVVIHPSDEDRDFRSGESLASREDGVVGAAHCGRQLFGGDHGLDLCRIGRVASMVKRI